MGLPVPQDQVSSLVKQAQSLVAKKDDIEAQLRELEESLQMQGVGMEQPLIDRSGFPRSDVDVAAARTSRNLVHRLRNDHKDVMKEIEEALHAVHEASRNASFSSSSTQQQQQQQQKTVPSSSTSQTLEIPFALVNAVAPDSPANISGLQRNDKVIRFGHVHAENHDRLQALNRLVGQSEGNPIQVVILRNDQPIQLVLTPKKWSGRGTLGCHIVPL
ncbi:26S proteasome non-ATPase regulatory subunit 9-like protein [Phascolomyces articulosus]|uniref:Probable 26S proteasome regulatory subunit p27 n=1 Tax=Phascolomyces articulosus TaxID=60185 RepID=A0AAD5K1E6_9FUNG|nr:26S proteasome non-ATPase regulatory subunit 9-like protein [Phascolomyces articulosus]